MKQEKIHDALNLLDDDLIEAVDALRNSPKKRMLRWTHWAGLAACICILAGIAWLLPFAAENTAEDGAHRITGTLEAEQENGMPGEMENGSVVSDSTSTVPQVTLCIDRWNENGFLGTVIKDGVWNSGTVIQVLLNKDTANDTQLPAGTSVVVRFTRSTREDALIIIYADQVWQMEDRSG